ncbi:MAG: hypothetical protein V3V41_04895 [Candidatus Heimdallarchaeota archaeon]
MDGEIPKFVRRYSFIQRDDSGIRSSNKKQKDFFKGYIGLCTDINGLDFSEEILKKGRIKS